MLGPDHSLSPRFHRVLVAGAAGTGKTTLARRIEAVTGLPYTEIDALFHGPGWTELPSFVSDVEAFTVREEWMTDWQYTTQLGDLLPSRADTVVWLDLSPFAHMSRLLSRTLKRRLRRTELWNGNLEPPLRTIFHDPEHIVRWGWSGRNKIRKRVVRAASEHPQLRIIRLRSQREVETWLQPLPSTES